MGVSQGLEPPLKVIVRPPHDVGVILLLLVHPLVVSLRDAPEDGVLVEEIAHPLLFLDISWPSASSKRLAEKRWRPRTQLPIPQTRSERC